MRLAGETLVNSWRVRPRNGPPEEVKMTRRTSARAPAFSAWKMAECSLSTGKIRVPRARASSIMRGPATTNVSLLAKATILPASRAAHVPLNPTAPTIALKTRSVRGSSTIRMMPSRPARTSMPVPRSSDAASGASSRSATVTNLGRCATACSAIIFQRARVLRPHALSLAPPSCSITLMRARADRARRAEDHDVSE